MKTGLLSSNYRLWLVEKYASEYVLKRIEDSEKISWAVLQWGTLEHNIGKRKFSLPNNFVPVTKSRLKILELENQEMKLTICALNSELAEAKKMLADNHPLVSLGDQLSKLKSINKKISLLAADIFYAVSQAVMPKASPEAISLGGVLIVGGLLEILGINDNKIISGIPNCIPSPSNLRYMLKKYREATFIRISGFVCNCPFRMSCNKGERDGVGCLVK